MANQDLTTGSITKKLIVFSLPFLGASLLQQLYNTVDLLFVGNLLSSNSYAAVGASAFLVTCMVVFFTGMSTGANVVISQAIGSCNTEKTQNAVHTSIGLSLIGGIVLTIVGYVIAPFVLRLMNTAPELMAEATVYLRIYILSLTSIFIYNMASGIIRATGNSFTPMLIQLAGGICNVAGDALLLYFFRNVNAVAWATMITQTFAAILSVGYLMRKKQNHALYLLKIKIHLETLKQIVKIGLPAGLQSLVITISNMFAQYHINSLGVNAVGAFTTYFKVELLLYYPIVALGHAMTTFTGQNIGAGKPERVKQGVKISVVLGVCIVAATAVILLPFGKPVFAIFNDDVNVLNEGMKIIIITFPLYWIYVFLQVFADTIRGTGKSAPPMLIIMANICVLRVILLFLFMGIRQDIRSIALTYPITWTTASLCLFVYYKRLFIKKKLISEAVAE